MKATNSKMVNPPTSRCLPVRFHVPHSLSLPTRKTAHRPAFLSVLQPARMHVCNPHTPLNPLPEHFLADPFTHSTYLPFCQPTHQSAHSPIIKMPRIAPTYPSSTNSPTDSPTNPPALSLPAHTLADLPASISNSLLTDYPTSTTT